MPTSQVNKDKVLASVVRTFFKYFVTGIIESRSGAGTIAGLEPKDIKEIMLQHYGDISKYFNKEVVFAILRMNYGQDEMEPCLRGFMTEKTTDMELIRFACRTEEFYQMMVSEYKRNFELLLLGRFETPDEHEDSYTRCASAGTTDAEMAERIVMETASNAYLQGKNIK